MRRRRIAFAVGLLFALCGLLAVGAAQAQGKKWALLIGIDRYENKNVSGLQFAVEDVRAVAKALQTTLGFDHVVTMTSDIKDRSDTDYPTALNVLDRLDTLATQIGPNDTFVFYFSGHGFQRGEQDGGQNFLGTIDARNTGIEQLRISALPMDVLRQKMKRIQAQQVIYIIDACRNDPDKGKGDADNKLKPDFSRDLVQAASAGKAGAKGTAALFACSEGQRSWEWQPFGHGAFTYYLLEGLKQSGSLNGLLTINDVAEYVDANLRKWDLETNHEQFPELRTEGAARIVLAQVSKPVPKPKEKVVDIEREDANAYLTLTTNPKGATVKLDGKEVGKTPLDKLAVPMDSETQKKLALEITLEGYRPILGSVPLKRGVASTVPALNLEKLAESKVPPAPSNLAKFKKNLKDDAEMIFIPAGEFTMGDAAFSNAEPHKVTLDGYYIYKTPITVAQYKMFVASDYAKQRGIKMPSVPSFNENWSKEDHPIVNVSYNDALEYCKWASGDKPGSVRLPTEAEWEKAASWDDGNKQKRKFPWGDEWDGSKCANSVSPNDLNGTKAVGSYPSGASPYGVLDMAGNVWQWCSDWCDRSFYSSPQAMERNPENQSVGEKKYRVLRGCSWYDNNASNFRSAIRSDGEPDGGSDGGGFRCVFRADSH